jgi:hypothetical protein
MLALLHSWKLWSERYPLYTVLIDFYLDSTVAKDRKLGAVIDFIKQLNYGLSVNRRRCKVSRPEAPDRTYVAQGRSRFHRGFPDFDLFHMI